MILCIANYVGLKRSPIPFTAWKKTGSKLRAKCGINFAFGGTGVFDTLYPFPNMTTQINFFQNLIANSIFTSYDIHSSIALVSPSGNDYSFYLATNGSPEVINTNIIIINFDYIFNCLFIPLLLKYLESRTIPTRKMWLLHI